MISVCANRMILPTTSGSDGLIVPTGYLADIRHFRLELVWRQVSK